MPRRCARPAGIVDVVNLPDIGIEGRSHMPMKDRSNGATADLIEKWPIDKGLAHETADRLMG